MTAIPTKSGVGGLVGIGYQADKDTVASTFLCFNVANLMDDLDWQEGDNEEEIGGDLDETVPVRYGHRGVSLSGEGKFRPGNGVGVLPLYGMEDIAGGLVLWSTVNDILRVKEVGGAGTGVNVAIIGGAGATLVSGVRYTPNELCAGLKAALDGNVTLVGTYTVTYSTVTEKFTITVTGGGVTELQLLWTTGSGGAGRNKALGCMLGFDTTVDNTGALTYTGGMAVSLEGRWWVTPGVDDVIRVTDDNGTVSVNVVSGAGAVLEAYVPYTGPAFAAGLQAALNGNTTLLDGWVALYTSSTNLFSIGHLTSTVVKLNFDHADNTIDTSIGYTATLHEGSTAYVSDDAIYPAPKHLFKTIPADEEFPWGTIYNAFATGDYVRITHGARVSTMTFDAGDRAPVRITWTGRGIDRRDPAEYYAVPEDDITLVDDTANIAEPHTGAGFTRFYEEGGTPEAYRVGTFNLALKWEEQVEPEQAQIYPYNVAPGRRSAEGTMLVYLGAEDDGALLRAIEYGSISGTGPDTAFVVRELDIMYYSGQTVPGQVGTTERYGIRFIFPECYLRVPKVDRKGLEKVTVTLTLTRRASEYYIAVVNAADYRAYEYV